MDLKEVVKEELREVALLATDWSYFADWFVEFLVFNDFELKSFEELIFMLELGEYYSPIRVWDFFFDWGETNTTNLEAFAENFISDQNEREDFINFVKKYHSDMLKETLEKTGGLIW